MINPKIQETSAETFCVWDSCFCFKLAFFVKVERFRKIRVEYQDIIGVQKVLTAEDELAELFQHEIDHLDGILFIERMSLIKRDFIKMRYLKKIKKKKRQP